MNRGLCSRGVDNKRHRSIGRCDEGLTIDSSGGPVGHYFIGMKTSTIRLRDVRNADVPSVGGKNASLGELIGTLGSEGINVPDGFAVTAQAYWDFLDATGSGSPWSGAWRDWTDRRSAT